MKARGVMGPLGPNDVLNEKFTNKFKSETTKKIPGNNTSVLNQASQALTKHQTKKSRISMRLKKKFVPQSKRQVPQEELAADRSSGFSKQDYRNLRNRTSFYFWKTTYAHETGKRDFQTFKNAKRKMKLGSMSQRNLPEDNSPSDCETRPVSIRSTFSATTLLKHDSMATIETVRESKTIPETDVCFGLTENELGKLDANEMQNLAERTPEVRELNEIFGSNILDQNKALYLNNRDVIAFNEHERRKKRKKRKNGKRKWFSKLRIFKRK